jgi:serine protease
VVAIIDTGIIKSNPDMVGRFLPGYDFIGSDDGSPNNITRDPDTGSQFSTANDGSGRDTDSSDPGDWIDQTDKNGFFTDPSCTIADSSWHGTFVSSIYGAAANNNFGIAGVDWNARILPVRVLGKCGGYTSDIMDGARWAAGIQVMGAGNQLISSPNPAQVINLSLGGPGACSNFEQTAINDILAAGGVKAIVTSAGNGDASGAGEDAGNNSPGNCNGVINVAATDRAGSLTGYSDFGATIAISAPGGFIAQGSNGQDGLISTANCGITNPITTVGGCPTSTDNQLTGAPYIAFFVTGTSFAAPQVSGAISLMLSVNPTLSAAQVTSLLKSTARAFPAASNCSSTLLNKCGAGILNVNAAVRSAAAMPGGSNPSPPASGGRGGGGGGCTLGDGPADWLLPLLVLVSLLGLTRGRQKQN